MTYQTLKAGDVRQLDDQYRRKEADAEKGPRSYTQGFLRTQAHEFRWSKVYLVGHPILPADLMITEFRRPI